MSPAEDKSPNADPGEEKSPAEIRAEIDETREELGDTVEALAAKTDVKAQAKAKIEEVKEAAPESPEEAARQARAIAGGVEAKAKQNPKPFAIAGGVILIVLLWRWLRS